MKHCIYFIYLNHMEENSNMYNKIRVLKLYCIFRNNSMALTEKKLIRLN